MDQAVASPFQQRWRQFVLEYAVKLEQRWPPGYMVSTSICVEPLGLKRGPLVLEWEWLERERLERERLKRERLVLERERLKRERLKRERLKRERLVRERLERERLVSEPERLKRERLKRERERLERERLERERLVWERLVRERLVRERLVQERLEQVQRKKFPRRRMPEMLLKLNCSSSSSIPRVVCCDTPGIVDVHNGIAEEELFSYHGSPSVQSATFSQSETGIYSDQSPWVNSDFAATGLFSVVMLACGSVIGTAAALSVFIETANEEVLRDQGSPSVQSATFNQSETGIYSDQSSCIHSDFSNSDLLSPSVHIDKSPSVHSDQSLLSESVHSAILGPSKTGNHSVLCFLTTGKRPDSDIDSNNELKVPVPVFRACGHDLGGPPRPHYQREELA